MQILHGAKICPCSRAHAPVYIPVGNAHPGYRRAGLLVPCGYSVLERVYKDERPVIPAILPGMTLFRKHLCMSRYQLRTLCLLRVALARTARPAVPPKNESPVLYLFGYKCAFRGLIDSF